MWLDIESNFLINYCAQLLCILETTEICINKKYSGFSENTDSGFSKSSKNFTEFVSGVSENSSNSK